jgi:hypothetical protein
LEIGINFVIRPGRDIDGRCDGKNDWDEIVRTLIPWILNISIMEW